VRRDFGPVANGPSRQGVVVLWVARHLFGGPLNYIGFGGTGKQTRDILHIDDLCRLVLWEASQIDDVTGETFNVGGGLEASASLLELTRLCEARTGQSIEIGADPERRAADVPLYITDNSRVTARTGWKPRIPVSDTVADIAAWIDEHRDALRPVLAP